MWKFEEQKTPEWIKKESEENKALLDKAINNDQMNLEEFKKQLYGIPKVSASDFFAATVKQATPSPFISVTVAQPSLSMKSWANESQFSRILLMGDSGTGKTHFIGTMPKPFVMDFDRGLATLRGKDVGYKMLSIDDWLVLKNTVQEWRKGAPEGFQTFALDSITMASEAAMAYVLKKNGHTGQQPNIGEWGDAIREVKDLLGYITTLPCNVVVTAHMQIVKDELLGDIQYQPLIFGKDLPSRMPIYFDEVYLTTISNTITGGQKTNEYQLQVKPDSRVKMLKSRMNTDGKLFNLYEQPDFAVLRSKTEGNVGGVQVPQGFAAGAINTPA